MHPVFRWHSLRTNIIIWLFIPTVIILIAVASFIFNSYDNVTEDLVIEKNQDLARLSSMQLVTQIREYEDRLDAEARKTSIYEGDPDAQKVALDQASNRLAVFDGGVIILDNYGTVVATEPQRPEILDQDWSDRSYYRDLIVRSDVSTSVAVFSNIVADGHDGIEVIVVAVRIQDTQGKMVGVMVGMFRMGANTISSFYGDLVKLHLGEKGNAYLVDGNGRVIYHTETTLIADDFSDNDVVQQVLSGQADAVRGKDYNGDSVVSSFAPVQGTAWGLVIQEHWSSVISSGKGYRNLLILIIVLGAIIPIGIVAIGIRRITKPIAMVSDAAKEIAAGNFDQEINIDTGDELEEMAEQFNVMASALKESYTNLEQKVKERTAGERRLSDQLRAINEAGRRISSILDIDELLYYVVKSLQETFNYYNVGIILIDQNSGTLTLKASAGAYGGGPEIGTDVMHARGIVNSVAESGEPLMVNDVLSHPAYIHVDALADTKAEMAAPIRIGDRIVGVLDIEANQVNAFDEIDLRFPAKEVDCFGDVGFHVALVARAQCFISYVIRITGFVKCGQDSVDKLVDGLARAGAEVEDLAKGFGIIDRGHPGIDYICDLDKVTGLLAVGMDHAGFAPHGVCNEDRDHALVRVVQALAGAVDVEHAEGCDVEVKIEVHPVCRAVSIAFGSQFRDAVIADRSNGRRLRNRQLFRMAVGGH